MFKNAEAVRVRTIFECVKILVEEGNEADVNNRGAYYCSALKLAECRLPCAYIGAIVQVFLKRYRNRVLDEDYLRWAARFSKLGASDRILGTVLAQIVKNHVWIREAENLAKFLGRRLTKDEIFSMVRTYGNDDAVMSESTEEDLLECVKKNLGSAAADEARAIFKEKKIRWESHIDP